MNKLTSFFLLVFFTVNYSFASIITGTVTDSESKFTLAGANIIIVGTNIEVSSASNGYYIISNVPEGQHTIKVSHIGYQAVTKEVEVTDEEPVLNLDLIRVVQNRIISGTVANEKGDGMPGVNISVEGTTLGTTTDNEGSYSLSVPDNAKTLIYSHVGYKTIKRAINSDIVINIQMEVDLLSLEEIAVVGYRHQSMEVIALKKETMQIADFLSQDNIGRLPDYAAADAARRIVGVNTKYDEDEATQIGLRGLPPIYTFTTIDGLAIPGTDRNTRVANFEVIPSSAISIIEVFKSRTADQDGNAIGGIINLRTRSAWDTDNTFFTIKTAIGKYDFDEVPRSSRSNPENNGLSTRMDATFASKFGNSKQFGIVLSGSYNRKDRDELKYPRTSYSFLNDDKTKPMPSRLRINAYDNIIDRYGAFGKLEYKPNNKFYASIVGSYYKKKDDEIRYETRMDALVFDEASLTPNGGSFTEGRNRFGNYIFVINHEIKNIIFDTYYKINDVNKIDMKLGYATGIRQEDGPGANFRSYSTTDNSGTFSISEDKFSFTLDDPSTYFNMSNYQLTDIGGYTRLDDENYNTLALNYNYNMDKNNSNWSFMAGYKYRQLNHLFDNDKLYLSYVGAEPLDLSDFILGETYRPVAAGQDMPLFDPYAINDFIYANPSLFQKSDNSIGTMYGRSIVDNPANEYNIEETVNAFYAAGEYARDNISTHFGLRYEITTTKTSRPIRVDGVYDGTVSNVKNDFNNLLPSLMFTYKFTNELKLKAAYNRAIGRADYGQLAPVERVNSEDNQIFRGNPELKPRKADNFDISLEYYFGKNNSLFSFAFFHKDIKDDIQTESTFEGDNEIITPVNIDGVTVTGIEINFIKSEFDFLPGFLSDMGLSSNYAFIIGERILNTGQRLAQVFNLPRHTINVQLYYQTKKFDARIAWNWIDKILIAVRPGQEFNNQYLASYNSLDFSTRYKFHDHFAVFFEARNILDENRSTIAGPKQSLLEQTNEFGKSFWLGVEFNF